MAKTKITIDKDTRKGRKKPWLVRWYGQYDPTGKQKRHCKSFLLKKEAERKLEEEIKKQEEEAKKKLEEEAKKLLNNLFKKKG